MNGLNIKGMQKNTCNILLFGGGLDSVCLASFLNDYGVNYEIMIVNYGQKAWKGELASAKYYGKILGKNVYIKKTNFYLNSKNPLLNGEKAEKHEQNVLHYRNLHLITLAASRAKEIGAKYIYVGFHLEPKDSKFEDAKPKFLFRVNKLFESLNEKVRIEAPFIKMKQEEYISTTRININKSFSCYESKTEEECGKCTHCIHKKELIKKSSSFNIRRN